MTRDQCGKVKARSQAQAEAPAETPAAKPPLGGGRTGIRAAISARNAPAAPASPALKSRLEELADEIKAAHAAGNPEKAYALSQERSKPMDGGDDYMTAMKTIMGKQEKLAKGEDRGILDKLIPLLRGGAMSKPGAHWSQVLSGGATSSIDHEANLKAEQKKAQEELLKLQGQHAGTQYTMTSGRHNAGLTAEKEANAAKRQQLGDRVQIEGALENSNMANRKFDQDAAQHKDRMAMDVRRIEQAAALADKQGKSEDKRMLMGLAGQSKLLDGRAKLLPKDQIMWDESHKQEAAAIAQERALIRQQYAMITGTPMTPAKETAGIDLSKWGQPKAK